MKVFLLLVLISPMAQGQPPVILHETFDNNVYGWFEGAGDDYRVSLQNGKYVIDATNDGWISSVAPYIEPDKDFSVEATFVQVNGRDDNGIGIIWGFDGGTSMNTFTYTTNGYYRVYCSDAGLGVADEWRETPNIRPMGEPNHLKIERSGARMRFYLNGQEVAATPALPWHGKYLGFVCYTKMRLLVDDYIFRHDIRINLLAHENAAGVRENLGPQINTRFDEVSP